MQKVSELQCIRLNGFAPNIESLKPRGVNLWDLRDLMDDARRIRPVGVFQASLALELGDPSRTIGEYRHLDVEAIAPTVESAAREIVVFRADNFLCGRSHRVDGRCGNIPPADGRNGILVSPLIYHLHSPARHAAVVDVHRPFQLLVVALKRVDEEVDIVDKVHRHFGHRSADIDVVVIGESVGSGIVVGIQTIVVFGVVKEVARLVVSVEEERNENLGLLLCKAGPT